jgi:hypothetical protein
MVYYLPEQTRVISRAKKSYIKTTNSKKASKSIKRIKTFNT